MKLTYISKLLIIFGFIFFSCDRPICDNQNPIFENNQPETEIYKNELANQLKNIDSTKLTFWLQKYEEENGKEYLYFHIQNENLCAILILTMKNWERLENVRVKKGVSYIGAEFANLKFDIKKDSTSTEFIYKSFEKIID